MPAAVTPIAVEYTFWDQRLPEALVLVGEPILTGSLADRRSAGAWQPVLEQGMAATQDALAGMVQARDPAAFRTVLRGRRGAGGFYGTWQRLQQMAGIGRVAAADHRVKRDAP